MRDGRRSTLPGHRPRYPRPVVTHLALILRGFEELQAKVPVKR